MKPSALRIERLLAKVEAECSARPRRYCFYYDEVAEAEAQSISVPAGIAFTTWFNRSGLAIAEIEGEKRRKQ
jgi:hypothetical protein